MPHSCFSLLWRIIGIPCAGFLLTLGPGVAAAPRPAGKSPAARPPARPAARPAKPPGAAPTAAPRPPAPPAISARTLGPVLISLGYQPTAHGEFQRLQVEEEEKKYGYFIDLSTSANGEWLVVTAHLAPIPDLTEVPSAPLLALLARNDQLVGMAFAYSRQDGRVVLNANLPLRGLDGASVRNLVEAMKATVEQTEGLWDPARW